MGIYFTGKFVDTELTNPVTKYITNEDAFGMGSSYGLRICTRFSASPNGTPISETISDIYNEFVNLGV